MKVLGGLPLPLQPLPYTEPLPQPSECLGYRLTPRHRATLWWGREFLENELTSVLPLHPPEEERQGVPVDEYETARSSLALRRPAYPSIANPKASNE